ncbi:MULTISPECIES: SMC-Scp complex subunit ScpB [Ochrobactrum]|uniref:SMC-Scp complex subunit ScpB n=1 Tax=Ochrobactrum chromiisoli TaxID=2993941 RepID=A0ABT3QL51_9HYPH|nr:SMC-Scp complex subunit ScpB [Ochrobactrum chromiisoli]MCX2696341.1 SMC-Scp complex subunit ScpB [Ochrobactrum chromiisoli]
MSEAEISRDGDDDSQHPTDTTALAENARVVEAIIFASAEPVSERALAERLPANADIPAIVLHLQKIYEGRGVHLVQVGAAWAFRTAPDLGFLLSRETVQQRKLSRAAMEVLAIIAYHQPVTRAELEDIRGVETSKGTLDVLMETGWIKLRGRRRTPGRPVTYGTTDAFLDQFGLPEIRDLPGLEELRGAGLLSARIPSGFSVSVPNIDPDELTDDEEPLEDIDLEGLGLLAPRAE